MSAAASFPTLILKVRKPSAIRCWISSAISDSSVALTGDSNGRRASSPTSSRGSPSSISMAVNSAVAATLLSSMADESIAIASEVSRPTICSAYRRQNCQPPSRVSLLEPGEICPSPQPMRPSRERISTMIGSNSVNVRYDSL